MEKKKKLDTNAQEVMDNLAGREKVHKFTVSAQLVESYNSSVIEVALAPYTERAENILLKLKTEENYQTCDELVLQIEIDPETKRMSLRK